jgi:D-alanyl-D-alanine carboxypeptidase
MRRQSILSVFVNLAALLAALPASAGPYVLYDDDTRNMFDHYETSRRWRMASVSRPMAAYWIFQAVQAAELQLISSSQ